MLHAPARCPSAYDVNGGSEEAVQDRGCSTFARAPQRCPSMADWCPAGVGACTPRCRQALGPCQDVPVTGVAVTDQRTCKFGSPARGAHVRNTLVFSLAPQPAQLLLLQLQIGRICPLLAVRPCVITHEQPPDVLRAYACVGCKLHFSGLV